MKKILVDLAVKIFCKIQMVYSLSKYSAFRKKYDIHDNFRFNGEEILFYGDGKIEAGQDSYLGTYSTIQSVDGCSVKIGRGCQMSHFVNMYTSNNAADKDYSCDDTMRSGDIVIGDFCWIGIKATIIGPVTIGENSCIAANSLVNRDIPPHCIAIGIPAKVIKFKSYLSQAQVLELYEKYKSVMSEELTAKLKAVNSLKK